MGVFLGEREFDFSGVKNYFQFSSDITIKTYIYGGHKYNFIGYLQLEVKHSSLPLALHTHTHAHLNRMQIQSHETTLCSQAIHPSDIKSIPQWPLCSLGHRWRVYRRKSFLHVILKKKERKRKTTMLGFQDKHEVTALLKQRYVLTLPVSRLPRLLGTATASSGSVILHIWIFREASSKQARSHTNICFQF